MKLYYAPGACSLAPHIAIREAGLDVRLDKVTFGEKRTTEEGADFYSINPQGAVPVLELDDGAVLTENAVLLQYIASKAPQVGVPGEDLDHWRLLETLNFIATELHKSFSPLFRKPTPEAREAQIKLILGRLALLQGKLGDKPFLMGDRFTIADAYAFVILHWARRFEIDLSSVATLKAYFERLLARPSVQTALKEEGLPTS